MIKYVRLVGVVVAVDEFPAVWVYTLDDGSGVNIEATCAAPPPKEPPLPITGNAPAPVVLARKDNASEKDGKDGEPKQVISPDGLDLTNIDVGSVVKIKGTIVVFREQMKVRLKAITVIRDTNAEVKCWNETVVFRREVLANPWVVTKRQERKCREDEDTEAKVKREEESRRKRMAMRKLGKERETSGKRDGGRDKLKENRSTTDGKINKGKEKGNEAEEKARQQKGKGGQGLDPENRVNYPSRAVRIREAGRFDALGL
jgi:Telomere regulation protein Stn1